MAIGIGGPGGHCPPPNNFQNFYLDKVFQINAVYETGSKC